MGGGMQAKEVATNHTEIIHDVTYDFYGKRMATCSSDQTIAVWDKDEAGAWVRSAEWKGHTGSIFKLAWAHPEFGQILASCSFDCTVFIWEEPEGQDDNTESKKAWRRATYLNDARLSVMDVKFAPRRQGLRLASASADGQVRIYEAQDVMNIDSWSLLYYFEAFASGCNSISWRPSRFSDPMIVVCGSDPSVKIYQYMDAYRTWEQVETLSAHVDTVRDVAWAPNMGRSFELIATASKDKTARLWRIETTDEGQLHVECIATFSDHNTEVWRVEWNVTGTVLASSGDDGNVFLWKSTFQKQWRRLATVAGSSDDGPSSSTY